MKKIVLGGLIMSLLSNTALPASEEPSNKESAFEEPTFEKPSNKEPSSTLSNSESETLSTKDIRIQVTDIDVKRSGQIMVMLFGEEGFPKNHSKAISTSIKGASSSTLNFVFSVGLDVFAIKVLHDENGDKQVTKNWTGILPAEGLGFSNGAKIRLGPIRFGPPSFNDAKLHLKDVHTPLNINILYP